MEIFVEILNKNFIFFYTKYSNILVKKFKEKKENLTFLPKVDFKSCDIKSAKSFQKSCMGLALREEALAGTSAKDVSFFLDGYPKKINGNLFSNIDIQEENERKWTF